MVAEIQVAARSEFGADFQGELIFPEDPGYEMARKVWNGMIDRYPTLIARVKNRDDVVASVKFARAHNLTVSVRGGGHNVAGLGTVDGGMVIDLSAMNEVQVDPENRTVQVAGGATLGDLDWATQKHGLAVPAGVVTETGVAGLTLGGGFGWLRNKFGLTCDNLIGAEVVTADGKIVRASETENADLLWGLRGGGGNFGVVTRFEFNAHPLGPEVYFVFVFHHGNQAEKGLQFYRDFMATTPDEVSSLAFLGVFPPGAEAFPEEIHGLPFLAFGALYAGDIEDGKRILEPLRAFSQPLADFSNVMPYVNAQQMFDEDYPKYIMRYYWKSINLNHLDDRVIRRIMEHGQKQPSPHSTTDLWPIGGAVKRFDGQHSAFYGREAAYLINPEANWERPEDDEQNIQWVREFIADLDDFSDGSRYLNFAGFQEEGDSMMKAAFGDHYQRLAELKAKYDPQNFFRLNQNIKPVE
jgi:FAD/FMN-containing dehydrogenase